jgi:hypothetical protein
MVIRNPKSGRHLFVLLINGIKFHDLNPFGREKLDNKKEDYN